MKSTPWFLIALVAMFLPTSLIIPVQAATTSVPCDVTALVSAISTANATAADDTLDLAAGCTYTLTAVDNTDAFGWRRERIARRSRLQRPEVA